MPEYMAAGVKPFVGDILSYENPTRYKSINGALQYITLSKPKLCFAIDKLSKFHNNPSQLQW